MSVITVNISRFKSSLLNPEFDSVQTIEIETLPFAEGGFGRLHHCLKINGQAPRVPQVIKIFVEVDSGVHLQGFKTIQKLQEKMISLNHQRRQKNEPALDQVPLLFALPQFSYEGMMNHQQVLGYSANRIDAAQFIEFEEILNDVNLQRRYYPLSLEQKLGYAMQLAEGVNLLRDMSFIHADINGQNLFISLGSGQLILIDFDSGAVTEDPNESPTTWGKPNEWAAPEIVAQIGEAQRSGRTGGQTVRVNLHTDTWSVAVGIHYLIFLRHPLFFLNCQGPGEMRAYFTAYQWPNVDHRFSNFNSACAASHKQIKDILTTHPQLPEITKRLAVTINQGFEEPRQRTTYYQWYLPLKKSNSIRHHRPPCLHEGRFGNGHQPPKLLPIVWV
jgi:serine/threonine protein kinase